MTEQIQMAKCAKKCLPALRGILTGTETAFSRADNRPEKDHANRVSFAKAEKC